MSTSESRVQKSRRISVGREIFDLKWNKEHLLVFPDGGVERLGVYAKEGDEEEANAGGLPAAAPAVLQPGDKLLESWICDTKGTDTRTSLTSIYFFLGFASGRRTNYTFCQGCRQGCDALWNI